MLSSSFDKYKFTVIPKVRCVPLPSSRPPIPSPTGGALAGAVHTVRLTLRHTVPSVVPRLPPQSPLNSPSGRQTEAHVGGLTCEEVTGC